LATQFFIKDFLLIKILKKDLTNFAFEKKNEEEFVVEIRN
jgi:hypothetical protein